MTALALLSGLVVYPVLATHRQSAVVASLGAASCLVLAVALVARWPVFAAWAFALFGAEYALYLRLGTNGVDSRAPFVAAALIASAELAFHAVERSPGRADGGLLRRAAGRLALLIVSSIVVAEVVLVAAGSVRSNLLFEALGVGAAVVAIGIVLQIAARSRRAA